MLRGQSVVDRDDCALRIPSIVSATIVLRVQSSENESAAVDVENRWQNSDVARTVHTGGNCRAVSAGNEHIVRDYAFYGAPTLGNELLLKASGPLYIREVEAWDHNADRSQLRVETQRGGQLVDSHPAIIPS